MVEEMQYITVIFPLWPSNEEASNWGPRNIVEAIGDSMSVIYSDMLEAARKGSHRKTGKPAYEAEMEQTQCSQRLFQGIHEIKAIFIIIWKCSLPFLLSFFHQSAL